MHGKNHDNKAFEIMKSAYIFGNGGHAHVISSIIHNQGYDKIIFIEVGPTDHSIDTEDIISENIFFDHINNHVGTNIFLGIGSDKSRQHLFEKLKTYEIKLENCISEDASIAHNADLGEGVVICPGSVIGARVKIGNNTIINSLSSVDHDCTLGNNSQIAAGVTLGGKTNVGDNCFFGIKSGTVPNVVVGDNSVVMAGSMVHKNIPENVMVGGNPAKIVKSV